MRLWHIELITALPREQLVAQWRELSAIAGAIQKNGTPNHLLVNFVTDYSFDHFISYAKLIRDEMNARKYRTSNSVWEKIVSLNPSYKLIESELIYKEKMDIEYFLMCFYNLYEKYTCGGFSDDYWLKIKEKKEKMLI